MVYLLILLALIGCMGLLDARFKLFVFDRPLPGLTALVLGTGIFLLWDVIAIGEGIFLHIDSPLMTGILISEQLPLEEVFFLFFLCYQSMVLINGWLYWRRARKTTPAIEGAK